MQIGQAILQNPYKGLVKRHFVLSTRVGSILDNPTFALNFIDDEDTGYTRKKPAYY